MSDDESKEFVVRVPDEIEEMDDEELMSELEALAAHEEADVLTVEQRTYLNNLRDEMYKRMSVGGPYADYEGGSDDA